MTKATWDVEEAQFGKRGYLSTDDILSQIRQSGKVLVPSNDFIFPVEGAMRSDTYKRKKFEEMAKYAASDLGAWQWVDINAKKLGLSKTGSLDAVNNATWDVVKTYEPKMYQALSRGIQDVYGFKPHHKTQDIAKELAYSMGVPNLPIEFKYGDDWAARTDFKRVQLNPRELPYFGKEALLAHELRHIKEGPGSSGSTLGKPTIIDMMIDPHQTKLNKAKQGKDLQQFAGKGKFKPEIDALDIVSFFEGKHFSKPFIKENLKRVAKGLPIIGVGASALMGEDASASTIGEFIPGGVDIVGQGSDRPNTPESEFDPRYNEYLKKLRRSK